MELTDFSTSSENPVSGTFGSGWKLVCVCVCVWCMHMVCVWCVSMSVLYVCMVECVHLWYVVT